MRSRTAILAGLLLLGTLNVAYAQDIPSQEMLDAMVRQITSKPVPTSITFAPHAGKSDGTCRLEHALMHLNRNGNTARSFSVLVDRASSPKVFFAKLSRVAVDADGSGRAYHPEDPLGKGVCEPVEDADGRPSLAGICALDQFSSGGAHVFSGTQKLSKDAFVSNWLSMWPKIRNKSLKPVTLAEVVPDMPKEFYFFHWRERGLTAFFKDNIIPQDNEGYPCRYQASDGARNGYFISSTTLENDSAPRADGCAPRRYLDAESVPFIVLPKGGFGKVGIGDVAIVQHKDRLVYAIVGDAGPATKLGEGSIALNAKLLGRDDQFFLNMKETWKLDIDSGKPVSILVIGNTRDSLGGNYSPRNVEAVARRELARWGGDGDGLARFEACRESAPLNGKR